MKARSKKSVRCAGIVAMASVWLLLSYRPNVATASEVNSVSYAAPVRDQDWDQKVREVLHHEIEAQDNDSSLWCYRKQKEKDGLKQQFVACQSKDGEIDRLKMINGKALSQQQEEAEEKRIEKLLSNPRAIEKQKREQKQDGEQARDLLKLIPEAFHFHKEKAEGDLLTLRFAPNPDFHPWGHEARVFHHMEGTLVLNTKQARLAEINGQLTSEVKFGGGFFGHLDKGGTFIVKQSEVGEGRWEVTKLDVNMQGKALFFKTIGVQQNEIDSDFQPLPGSETMREAAERTKREK